MSADDHYAPTDYSEVDLHAARARKLGEDQIQLEFVLVGLSKMIATAAHFSTWEKQFIRSVHAQFDRAVDRKATSAWLSQKQLVQVLRLWNREMERVEKALRAG